MVMYQVSVQRDESCLLVLLRGGHPVHPERCESIRKWTARSRNLNFCVVSVMVRSFMDLICQKFRIFLLTRLESLGGKEKLGTTSVDKAGSRILELDSVSIVN